MKPKLAEPEFWLLDAKGLVNAVGSVDGCIEMANHRKLKRYKVVPAPLPGMAPAIKKQADAAAIAQGEQLSAAMLQPGKNISVAAGKLEKDSPLFFGQGENPLLF